MRSMAADWFPVIDSGKCMDDCFKCFNFCPQKVFEKQGKKTVVGNPDACLEGCDSCRPICPKDAISFIKSRVIEIDGTRTGITGLENALAMDDFDEAFAFIKEHNYVPEEIEDRYREAVRKEFDRMHAM